MIRRNSRFIIFTLLGALLFGCVTANPSEAAVILPTELAAISKNNGCDDLAGFYDYPDQMGVPYVYGVLPGPKKDSAAFWCPSAKDDSTSLLIVRTTGDGEVLDVLPYPNYPGSLALMDKNKFEEIYGQFSKVLKPISDKLRELDIESESIIVAEYDGVLAHFYIRNGSWWYFIAH